MKYHVPKLSVAFRQRAGRYYSCDLYLDRRRVAAVAMDQPTSDLNVRLPDAVIDALNAWEDMREACGEGGA